MNGLNELDTYDVDTEHVVWMDFHHQDNTGELSDKFVDNTERLLYNKAKWKQLEIDFIEKMIKLME